MLAAIRLEPSKLMQAEHGTNDSIHAAYSTVQMLCARAQHRLPFTAVQLQLCQV